MRMILWRKLPFTRNVLKSYIRESTSRSFPWVIHDKLAKKHVVSTEPPVELRDKLSIQNGCPRSHKHRRKSKEDGKTGTDTKYQETSKRKKLETENSEVMTMTKKKGTESPALHKRSRDIAQMIALERAVLRRSTRVHAPPKDSPALAFLQYVNKRKERHPVD